MVTVSEIRQWQVDSGGWYVNPVNRDKVRLGDGVRLGDDVSLGDYTRLGTYTSLGNGVRLGSDVSLGDDVSLGNGVSLGDHTSLGSDVSLGDGVRLGNYTSLGNGVSLGDDVRIDGRFLTIQDKYVCHILPTPDGMNIRLGCKVHCIDDWDKHGAAYARSANESLWWEETGKYIYQLLRGEAERYQATSG